MTDGCYLDDGPMVEMADLPEIDYCDCCLCGADGWYCCLVTAMKKIETPDAPDGSMVAVVVADGGLSVADAFGHLWSMWLTCLLSGNHRPCQSSEYSVRSTDRYWHSNYRL